MGSKEQGARHGESVQKADKDGEKMEEDYFTFFQITSSLLRRSIRVSTLPLPW